MNNRFDLILASSFPAFTLESRELVSRIKSLARRGQYKLGLIDKWRKEIIAEQKRIKRLESDVSRAKTAFFAAKGELTNINIAMALNGQHADVYAERLKKIKYTRMSQAIAIAAIDEYESNLKNCAAVRKNLLEQRRNAVRAIDAARLVMANAIAVHKRAIGNPSLGIPVIERVMKQTSDDLSDLDKQITTVMAAYNASQLMDVEGYQKALNDDRARAGREAKKQNQIRMKRESSAVHATRNALDTIVVNSRGAQPDQFMYDVRKRPKAKRYGSK